MKIRRVNIGELIKQTVDEKGWSSAHFAKQIGIQRQNVTKSVFQKKSLDTNLLCVISEVLEFNFFDYYKADDVECNFQDYSRAKEVTATLTLKIDGQEVRKSMEFMFNDNI